MHRRSVLCIAFFNSKLNIYVTMSQKIFTSFTIRNVQFQLKRKIKLDLIHRFLSIWDSIKSSWRDGFLKPIMCWLLLLFIGTLFYATENFNGNFYQGFYFAVNVFFSIGWGGFTEVSFASKLFSVLYIIVGAAGASKVFAYFTESIIRESSLSLNKIAERNVIERNCWIQQQPFRQWYIWATLHNQKLLSIYIWVIFIFIGTCLSCLAVKWPFIDGLYFSTSSMSTCGLVAIPVNSPNWLYVLVGIFSCAGVPIMGMAMGNVASIIVDMNRTEKLHTYLRDELNEEEYNILTRLQESNFTGDAQIKRQKSMDATNVQKPMTLHEYLLFSLIRCDVVSIETISIIAEHFKALDTDGNEFISYDKPAVDTDSIQTKQDDAMAYEPVVSAMHLELEDLS